MERRVTLKDVASVAGFMSQHKYGLPATPTRTYVDGYWIDGGTCPPVGKSTADASSPESIKTKG